MSPTGSTTAAAAFAATAEQIGDRHGIGVEELAQDHRASDFWAHLLTRHTLDRPHYLLDKQGRF